MPLPRFYIANGNPVRASRTPSGDVQAEVFDRGSRAFVVSAEMLDRLRNLPERGISEVDSSLFDKYVGHLSARTGSQTGNA